MKSYTEKAGSLLARRKAPLYAACIAVVLTLPALGIGFMADDYMHRAVFLQPEVLDGLLDEPFTGLFTFANGDPSRANRLADLGLFPWFMNEELRLSFWRPVAVATHWLDYALWPDSPLLMHLHSLVWFALAVAAVALLYQRLMGPGLIAGLAAVLFAVDDAHAWPAGWIANRNVLVALLFAVLALLAHERWRRGESRLWSLVSVACLVLALFAKEEAVSICGYLLGYALFSDKGTLRARVLSLLPAVLVVAAWRAFYVLAGFGASASSSYIDPIESPFRFLEALVVRGPILLQGLWVVAPSDAYTFGPPALKVALLATACLLMVLLAALLFALVRRSAVARLWCTGMLLALVPVAATGPQDRLLVFAGIGAMGLVAQLLIGIRNGDLLTRSARAPIWPSRLAYSSLILCHLIVAPILLPGIILGFATLNGLMVGIIEDDLPSQGDLAGRTVILVNGSNYPLGTYLFINRALAEQPLPAHVRSFAPASMAAVSTEITRVDDFTLTARPEGGYPWSLVRGDTDALALGDVVRLTGVVIEVTSLADEGWPSEVTYTFDRSLDDPSMLWFRAKGVNYVPLMPPRVGETLTVGTR